MNARLLTTLLLAAAAPAALAWPFQAENRSGGIGADDLQTRAIQIDTDRLPEIYGGGHRLWQVAAGVDWSSPQAVFLPLPDNDPHAADAPVSWSQGRGDAGDIDNDGDTDIVYSSVLFHNGGSNLDNVRILACRNNGDGTWSRQWQLKNTSVTVIGAPEVKLADFDRDGDLDLAETSNGLRVMWNDGTGNFSTASPILYAGYPAAPGFTYTPELEVADFDGNGWPDIALIANVRLSAADHRYNDLRGRLTLFSNDHGAFTAGTLHTLPERLRFQSSAAADMDGDGRLDLLVTSDTTPEGAARNSEMRWFRNTGDGFAAPVLTHSHNNQHPIVFVPADLDEDGIMDIVLSDRAAGVEYLRGRGDGTFSSSERLLSEDVGVSWDFSVPPQALCVADFDGDGDPDIMCRYGLKYLKNLAIRTRSDASVTAFSGINPTGSVNLTAGDVNNDGKVDLIAADGGGRRIRWYAGNGAGLDAPSIVSTGSLEPLSVAAGDFNNDGWTDLAWTTANTLSRALSHNGSGFSWDIGPAATMSGITRILPEDMDRDGDTDIASISPSAGLIRWHVNNGDATAWLPQNVRTGLTGLTAFELGQIIPGGRPEIVALASGIVNTFRHNSVTGWNNAVFGLPDGLPASRAALVAEIDEKFPGPETLFVVNDSFIRYEHDAYAGPPQGFGVVGDPITKLASADWNGDGLTDILAATTNSVSLFTHIPNASVGGGFQTKLLEGVSIQDIVVMDLNGDHYPDAVAADSTGRLHLIYNRSAAVSVEITGHGTQRVAPGGSRVAFSVRGTRQVNQNQNPEAASTPGSMTLRFLRSNVIGGVDSPGTALTQAEVSALIGNLTVVSTSKAGYTPVQVVPADVTAGVFRMYLGKVAYSVDAGEVSTMDLRVALKPTAAGSAVTRFYVEYSPASPWVALDQQHQSGPTALRITGTSGIQRSLFIVSPPSPLEEWRMTHFFTYDALGYAANEVDTDGDGVANLLEYVTGQNPRILPTGGAAPVLTVSRDLGLGVMTAELRLLTACDSRVRLTVEHTLNPADGWTTLSTRTGTGAWTGVTPYTTVLNGGLTRFVFDSGHDPAVARKAFFRLQAEELP